MAKKSEKKSARRVLKKDKVTLTLKKLEPHSILAEENKFFKGEFANEKMRFFSE